MTTIVDVRHRKVKLPIYHYGMILQKILPVSTAHSQHLRLQSFYIHKFDLIFNNCTWTCDSQMNRWMEVTCPEYLHMRVLWNIFHYVTCYILMSHVIFSRWKNRIWRVVITPWITDAIEIIFFTDAQTEIMQCIFNDAAISESSETTVFNKQITATYVSDSSEGTSVVYSSAVMSLDLIQ